MKYIISERQYKLITEDEDRKVLKLPGVEVFGGWEYMKEYLNKKGNPLFSVKGDLDLEETDVEYLNNLVSVSGNLYLWESPIKSLVNLEKVGGDVDLSDSEIESLDNLVSVGGNLNLYGTKIKSLDNLVSVGGDLDLRNTPLSYMYTKKEIKEMVEVVGDIYM